MAITPNGETGKTIQLKRTSLAYNDSKVTAEQLNYGEPLYNDNDKTLIIGDSSTTSNANLKVLKAIDRNKANSQVFLASTGSSTLDSTSNIGNLYSEDNSSVYVQDKNWDSNGILIPNTTTYNFTVDSNNNIVVGSQQSTAFSSLPCLQQITVEGMKSSYTPTISLYLINTDANNVANTKAKQKAFGCISRVDTAENKLLVVFFKKPASQFRISVVGG